MALTDVRFGLVDLLSSNPSIAAIVSGRIYPVILRQGIVQDSIVYVRITELESYSYVAPSGLVSARFQFDSWSQSADQAQILADLVKETLGGFKGQIVFDNASPPNFVKVQGIFLINGRDDFDGETRMYRMSRDYFVWYQDQ